MSWSWILRLQRPPEFLKSVLPRKARSGAGLFCFGKALKALPTCAGVGGSSDGPAMPTQIDLEKEEADDELLPVSLFPTSAGLAALGNPILVLRG